MSVRLYPGFKLPNCSLDQLLLALRQLEQDANRTAREVLAKETLALAVFARDAQAYGITLDWLKPLPADDFLLAASTHIAHLQEDAQARRGRAPDVDMGLELVLFPAGADLLGLVFTESRDLRALVAQLPGYLAYPYWDNQDCPEDLTQEAWDQRGAEWQAVLPGWGAPADYGFVRAVVPPARRHTLEDATLALALTLAMPTPAERAKRLFGLLYDEGKTELPRARSLGEAHTLMTSQAWQDAKAALAARLPPCEPFAAGGL